MPVAVTLLRKIRDAPVKALFAQYHASAQMRHSDDLPLFLKLHECHSDIIYVEEKREREETRKSANEEANKKVNTKT